MVFLELALFGIRNFTQLARFAFKPGFNLILGGIGSGKSTIRDALFALLAPISDTPPEALKTRDSNACQAGLVFKGDQDRVYRLVRDFVNRKSSLAELDASKKFQVMMQEENAIVKFLAEQTGKLPLETARGLFSMKGSWMPSAHDATGFRSRPSAASSAPASSFAPFGETKAGPQDRAQKEKRLKELKELLAQGDKLAAMEDQLADTQSRLAEINRRMRIAMEKTSELARLMEQGESLKEISSLPENYRLIVESSEEQEQRKNEQLASIAEEAEYLMQELSMIPSQPFFLNKLFIAGVALVLLPLILAGVLNLEGLYQQLLMLVVLAGIGLIGYVGFLDFGKLNKRKGVESKLRENDRQRMRIEAAFKKENSQFIELLKKAGCPDIATLKTKIREYEQFLAARRQLEAERDQFLSGKTIDDLKKDAETLTNQISEIEKKLKASSTLPSDIYLIQEEARTLERELFSSGGPKPGLPPLPRTDLPEDQGLSASPNDGSAILSSPFKSGLQAPAVQTFLVERLSELKTLTARLIGKIGGPVETEMTLNGNLVPALTSPKNAPIPWDSLSSGQRDLYHLAYHLAVVQMLMNFYPFPLLLDNPLTILDPRHQQAALDILREIAQNRQVLLFSSVSHPERVGDHLIQLK